MSVCVKKFEGSPPELREMSVCVKKLEGSAPKLREMSVCMREEARDISDHILYKIEKKKKKQKHFL